MGLKIFKNKEQNFPHRKRENDSEIRLKKKIKCRLGTM